jgi:hypothetical protein
MEQTASATPRDRANASKHAAQISSKCASIRAGSFMIASAFAPYFAASFAFGI